VRHVLEGERSSDVVEEAVQAIITSPAIDEALTMARQHVDEAKTALDGFPDSLHRTALLGLADFTVDRHF
jgi:geranylgeranyl pyrophosphate synthase